MYQYEQANADVVLFLLYIFCYYLSEICPLEIYFPLLKLWILFFHAFTKLKTERVGIPTAAELCFEFCRLYSNNKYLHSIWYDLVCARHY